MDFVDREGGIAAAGNFPLEQWFWEMPVCTRVWTTATVLTSILLQCKVITPFQLFYSFRAVYVKSQYWRLFTTFTFIGPLSLDLVLHLFFLQRYSRLLESGSNSSAHYSWLILFCTTSLLVLSTLFLSLPFLGTSLSSTLVYIWSRRNPDTILGFLGALAFPAPYLPWVLMAFSFCFHGDDHGGTLVSKSPAPESIPKVDYDKFQGLFVAKTEADDKDESSKVQATRQLLVKKGVQLDDPYVLYALRSKYAKGDVQKAHDLLILVLESFEGMVKEYTPRVRLLGAENRKGVTCWLDALLFALFCRLGSFEAMLYNSFDDVPRTKLAALLRLWVNMLRDGKLITTDITKLIQKAIAECGWEDASELYQHDASEAFTFLSDILELPFLTLKMDIYHTGREDANDDHKFVTERLLEVAIPSSDGEDFKVVTLEDCLETYFNNRIEVKRYLERRSTLTSMKSYESDNKNKAVHVETVEVGDASDSAPTTPISPMPSSRPAPPIAMHRTSSIVQRRFVPDEDSLVENAVPGSGKPQNRPRKGSVRKEVMMPAWQFFSLIPWYTSTAPTNDAQVANHFSSKRPILGICLKRYSMTPTGTAIRLDTKVDIPIEVGLPHFIHDDKFEDDGPLYGNFKLSLQSVVCHRGNSVESGHYISLVRGTSRLVDKSPQDARPLQPGSGEDPWHWLRFDDLATERITLVDIEEAIKNETPYLLFYQIVPVDGDPGQIDDEERPRPFATSEGKDSGIADLSLKTSDLENHSNETRESRRTSMINLQPETTRGRSTDLDNRRRSIAFLETQVPHGDHKPNGAAASSDDQQQPSRRSSIKRTGTHSRSSSQTGEKRASTFSRIAGMVSREKLGIEGNQEVPEVVVSTTEVPLTNTYNSQNTLKKEKQREKSGHREDKGARERSSNRLGKMPPSSRFKANKPDRDCTVM
ncbi:MAG: hypothetical protein Q9160_007637 [Pyrenula sp. 1 TL-2023]